ncbi:MAG TPA: glycosyltransferase [Ignavibacteria bacterium]|nr:glycosyltransferase [Ignavibacteria bacterium]
MPEEIKNLSILMPVYNCGKYVRGAIKSILNQTFTDFEFIIIDDGSTDETEAVIKEFSDKRINYKRTDHKGTSAALNYGIRLCSNEWIARIDSDDLNVSQRLEKQIKYLAENPEIDILSSWSVYFRDPAKILFFLSEPQDHKEIHKYLDLHNPLNQSALICRKEIFSKYKFNEQMNCYEDYELLYRLRDDYTLANMPEYLVFTRLHSGSRTIQGSRDSMFDLLNTGAFRKMVDSKSKGDHFYWASVTAWLNYFYGSRQSSRGYFRNSFSLKNLTAYFTTFLPDKYFFKFINSHFRYRLRSIFKDKSFYKKELASLLE